MKINRQQIMVGVLGVVLIWALVQVFGSGSGPAPDLGPDDRADLDMGEMPVPIATLLEEGTPPEFTPGGRNLFAFGQPKAVAKPPPERKPPKPQQAKRPAVKQQAKQDTDKPPAPPPVKAAPPVPVPPQTNFTFVGYLGPQGKLIGVFDVQTPDGNEIVLAREGEVLAEKFRVTKIGYEEVEIGYTEEQFLNERKTLPMGGRL